ncbi:MAG: SAM-dependent methyltransferase [Cytophagales bacterium]|jgi:16S rRNA (cytidine1402-2'-O)-methyltransferase|nr:SAM-dependent methyltransferase [Cytophagales bacterium]
MSGTLFLVPVAISSTASLKNFFPDYNLEIILKANNFIVENARMARNFLSQCGKEKIQTLNIQEIDKHDLSFEQIKIFTEPLLKNEDLVILSENGCPCVADPGNLFVRFAHEKNIRVVPLIGPSSIILALMASGLNGQKFCFHGYFPLEKLAKEKKIRQLVKDVNNFATTSIFIETPYRNNFLFQYLINNLPNDISLCVATDITGKNENIKTKKIQYWKNFKFEIEKLPTIFLFGN